MLLHTVGRHRGAARSARSSAVAPGGWERPRTAPGTRLVSVHGPGSRQIGCPHPEHPAARYDHAEHPAGMGTTAGHSPSAHPGAGVPAGVVRRAGVSGGEVTTGRAPRGRCITPRDPTPWACLPAGLEIQDLRRRRSPSAALSCSATPALAGSSIPANGAEGLGAPKTAPLRVSASRSRRGKPRGDGGRVAAPALR